MNRKINLLGTTLAILLLASCANDKKISLHLPREAAPPIEISLGAGVFEFPTGKSNLGTGSISQRYALAPTEVTYDLWFNVKMWAISNGYSFHDREKEGSTGTPLAQPTVKKLHPVTNVNWYDAVVWCNAYTEWSNIYRGTTYTTVYNDSEGTIRNAYKTAELDAIANPRGGTGFRLPTSMEWEFAARWQGKQQITANSTKKNYNGIDYYFTNGNAAARSSSNLNNNTATNDVCWNSASSFGVSFPVKKLQASVLGLYDMSGNVAEWCFDDKGSNEKVLRGGGFNDEPKDSLPIPALAIGVEPKKTGNTFADDIGFRIARNL